MLKPCRVTVPSVHANDPRVGHLLRRAGSGPKPSAVLIGFPCDAGVVRNGGRPGAARAPERIRHWLYRLTPDPERAAFSTLLAGVEDWGDLVWEGELEAGQEELGRLLAPLLTQGIVPIILGGGHETAYGHFLGYVGAEREVAILNWDAHCDVRDLKAGKGHSGSPFRQACEHPSGRCRSYQVAGLAPHSAAAAHVRYVQEHGGYRWAQSLDESAIVELYRSAGPEILTSFDIDAVDQAWAPGVSAPATGGLTPALWLEAARQAGRCPAVRSVDLVEVNPELDRDEQTCRLAALTIWHFLGGLAERKALR